MAHFSTTATSLATFLLLLAPAALAGEPSPRREGVHAPAGTYLDGERHHQGPRTALAARLHRVEVDVVGPAGAPLVVVAGPLASGAAEATLDPAGVVVLADARLDGTRLGPEGVWRATWPISDALPIGREILVQAFVLEPAGPRRLGEGLVLEVVDLWTFERDRLAHPVDRAGWSQPEAASAFGSWRTRAFRGCGAGASADLTVDVELAMWTDGAPPPRAFVAVLPARWPDAGDAIARAAWLARALQANGVRALAPLEPADDAVDGAWRVASRARIVAGHDDERGTHLVIGTGAQGLVDWRLERVRVVLRAAR